MLEGFRFFLGELTGFDQLVDQGLVTAHLREAVAAQDIGPAVADLSHEQASVQQRRDRRGGAHAAARPVGARLVEDADARFFDRLYQAARELVVIDRRLTLHELFVDDVDGQLACDLAGGRAAHAVAHAEQHAAVADGRLAIALHQAAALARQIGDEEVVFVVLSDLSHIGTSEDAYLETRARNVVSHRASARPTSSRNRCCPIRTWSPGVSSRSERIAK